MADRQIAAFVEVFNQIRDVYYVCPGSREGVIYLGGREGHFATAAGQEGHAGQCADYQVQDLSRRRGRGPQRRSDQHRENGREGEREGERSSTDDEGINNQLPSARCRVRLNQRHLGNHRPPNRAEVEFFVFRWSCRLLAAIFPIFYSPTAIIRDVYRLWPFVPRRTCREYVDALKEYIGSFQRASMMPTNVSAANLIELCGSEELRRFLNHLMTETAYWGPPDMRPTEFVGDIGAIDPAGELNVDRMEPVRERIMDQRPVMEPVEAVQPIGPIERQMDDRRQLDGPSGVRQIVRPGLDIGSSVPPIGAEQNLVAGSTEGGRIDIMTALGRRTGAVPKNRDAARIYPDFGVPGPSMVERQAAAVPAVSELATPDKFDSHTYILHAPGERPNRRYLLSADQGAAGPVLERDVSTVDVHNQPTIRLSMAADEASDIYNQPTLDIRPSSGILRSISSSNWTSTSSPCSTISTSIAGSRPVDPCNRQVSESSGSHEEWLPEEGLPIPSTSPPRTRGRVRWEQDSASGAVHARRDRDAVGVAVVAGRKGKERRATIRTSTPYERPKVSKNRTLPYGRLMPGTSIVVVDKELIDVNVTYGYERYLELAEHHNVDEQTAFLALWHLRRSPQYQPESDDE